MAVYASPLLTPIWWLFGWPAVAKLTDQHAKPISERCETARDQGPDAALQVATVWACIRLISETIATLPLMLYRAAGDGGRVLDRENPLFGLLHDQPHYDFTAVEFWEGVATSLCTGGNAYAEKLYVGNRVVALRPLPWNQVEVFRTAGGARRYRFHEDGRRPREIAEDDMFHVRGFGTCGDVGLSPISFARQTLYAARAAERASSKLYDNSMRHSVVLKMPQVLTSEQRTQATENILRPIVNGGSGILEAGMEPVQLTMSAQDAQMLETRSFQVEEICRWFRVPPFMVGHTQKSTSWGTGLEQQNIGFLTYALRPYLSRIEQTIRRSLIPPAERQVVTAEFKVEGLLRADTQTRTTDMVQRVQNGLNTRDEMRALDNWPAMGGAAAQLTVQSQNVPIDATASTPAAPDAEAEED